VELKSNDSKTPACSTTTDTVPTTTTAVTHSTLAGQEQPLTRHGSSAEQLDSSVHCGRVEEPACEAAIGSPYTLTTTAAVAYSTHGQGQLPVRHGSSSESDKGQESMAGSEGSLSSWKRPSRHESLSESEKRLQYSSRKEETAMSHTAGSVDGSLPSSRVKFPPYERKTCYRAVEKHEDQPEDFSVLGEHGNVVAEINVPSEDVLAVSAPTPCTVSIHSTTLESGVHSQHTSVRRTSSSGDDVHSDTHRRKPDDSDECSEPTTAAETNSGAMPANPASKQHAGSSTDRLSSFSKVDDLAEPLQDPSVLNMATDSSDETIPRPDLLPEQQFDMVERSEALCTNEEVDRSKLLDCGSDSDAVKSAELSKRDIGSVLTVKSVEQSAVVESCVSQDTGHHSAGVATHNQLSSSDS